MRYVRRTSLPSLHKLAKELDVPPISPVTECSSVRPRVISRNSPGLRAGALYVHLRGRRLVHRQGDGSEHDGGEVQSDHLAISQSSSGVKQRRAIDASEL